MRGRAIAWAVLALPLGVVAFLPLIGPLFSVSVDIADWPMDALAMAAASLAAYLVFGVVVGYFNPSSWLVAGVLSWLAVVDALYNLAYAFTDPTYPRAAVTLALLLLVGPLLTALLGGLVGRTFARPRAP